MLHASKWRGFAWVTWPIAPLCRVAATVLSFKSPAAIMSLAQNGTSGFQPLPKTSTAHSVSPTGEGCQTRRKLWNTQNMTSAKDRRPWNAGRMNGAKRALDRPAASVSAHVGQSAKTVRFSKADINIDHMCLSQPGN